MALVLLAACGGGAGSNPSKAAAGGQTAGSSVALTTSQTTRPSQSAPTTAPCPNGAVTVSPLGEWTVIDRQPALTGKAAEEKVVWQDKAAIANTTTLAVEVQSIVAVNLVRPDASSFVAMSRLKAAAMQNDIGVLNGPVVHAGEALPVLTTVKTTTGWGVTTNAVYVQATFPDRKDCAVNIVGAKPYANAPSGLLSCSADSAYVPCFK